MAESYLRRLEVGYPPKSGSLVGTYGIKIFTNEDLADLQNEVNDWLVELPQTSDEWVPHVMDTEYSNFVSTQGQPTTTHLIKITLFLVGRVSTTPVQIQA